MQEEIKLMAEESAQKKKDSDEKVKQLEEDYQNQIKIEQKKSDKIRE